MVRLICGDDSGFGPGYKDEAVTSVFEGTYPGRAQPIHAGSYIRVENSARLEQIGHFSVAAMIWPTMPGKGRQTILSKWSVADETMFDLHLDRDGALALQLGFGPGSVTVLTTGKAVQGRNWYLATASYDADTGELAVRQIPADRRYSAPLNQAAARKTLTGGSVVGNDAPLLMAAFPAAARAACHYSGKIDAPMLVAEAIREDAETILDIPTQNAICRWDFSKDISSTRIADLSGNDHHGQTVNLPARAMTGWNWDGSITDIRPGLYAATLESSGSEAQLPFVIRPPRGKEAKIAFLMPTYDHMAYGNEHMGESEEFAAILRGRPYKMWELYKFLKSHPEYSKSLYDLHADGGGVCYSSRLRPILQMQPKCQVPWATADANGNSCNARKFNFDTYFVDWLGQL